MLATGTVPTGVRWAAHRPNTRLAKEGSCDAAEAGVANMAFLFC